MTTFETIDLSSLNAIIPDKYWDDFMKEIDGQLSFDTPGMNTETLIKGVKIKTIVDELDIPDDELEVIQAKLQEVLYKTELHIRID